MIAVQVSVAEEVFSLQESYEIEIDIKGTDQKSIHDGMVGALSSLVINITGNSQTLRNKSIISMMKSPQKYVSQYRLRSESEKLIANFLFDGDSLRQYLGESQLPLWLSKKPVILAFLSCEINFKEEVIEDEISACFKLRQNLKQYTDERKTLVIYPLMDMNEVSLFESLGAAYPERFMKKISRRYEIRDWISCSIKDEFGLLLDKPMCITSEDRSKLITKNAIDLLIDKIKANKSLIVDKSIQNYSYVSLSDIDSFEDLEFVLKELKSQVLIFKVTLESIEGNRAKILLSHFGRKEDLQNLLNIHSNFQEINSLTEDIISYYFINSSI